MIFSKYFDSFNPAVRKRYCEKLKFIDDIDHNAIKDRNFTYNINCFPLNYLSFFRTSPFLAEDMAAYKNLDAYNQILKRWLIESKH